MAAVRKTPAKRYKYARHTAWRRVENESIVLDLNTSVYFSLNETASFVWEKLGEGLTVDEVAEQLSEEFEVSAEDAAKDVAELVDSLLKESLLVAAE